MRTSPAFRHKPLWQRCLAFLQVMLSSLTVVLSRLGGTHVTSTLLRGVVVLGFVVLMGLVVARLAERVRHVAGAEARWPPARAVATPAGAALALVLLLELAVLAGLLVEPSTPYGPLDLERRLEGYQRALLLDFSPGSLAYSADGRRLLLARPDGALALWPADGQAPPVRFDTGGVSLGQARLSPDGQTVAALLGDGTLRLWRASDGAPLRSVPLPGLSMLAFSPDSARLAGVGETQPGLVWRMADGELLQRVRHPPGAGFLAFAPDGGLIIHPLAPSPDARRELVFAPDGALLAVADADGGIRLERRLGRETVRTLAGDAGTVMAMAFSPDSALLAAAKLSDNSVEIWRVADGRRLARLHTRYGARDLAFAPDNRTLAVGELGLVSFWRVPERP